MKTLSHTKFLRTFVTALLLSLLLACNHYISPYDQYAYSQTTALKVDVIHLMDEATEPYSQHEAEVEEVVSKMRKAIEYEKHRPKNDITVKMWQKMLDSTAQKGIVGSFLASWKQNGTKSRVLIEEYKPIAAQGFDLIAELESKKIEQSAAGVTQFLNK